MRVQIQFIVRAGAVIRRVDDDPKRVSVKFNGHEPMSIEVVSASGGQLACIMDLPNGVLPSYMQDKVSVYETVVQADVHVPLPDDVRAGLLLPEPARFHIRMGKYAGSAGMYALVLSSGDPSIRKVVVKGSDLTSTLEFFYRLLNERVEPLLAFPGS